jgi:hypothetical protein
MRTLPHTLVLFVSAVVTSLGMFVSANANDIVVVNEVADVKIENVQFTGDAVRGTLVNDSDRRIEDLTVRITYSWRWADEYNPGDSSPGWSTTVPVSGELAPGERREFEFAANQGAGTSPSRQDGHFATDVSVIGYTAYDGVNAGTN